MSRLEEAIRQVTGQAWTVRVDGAAETAAAPARAVDDGGTARGRRRWAELAKEVPLLKRASDVLGAQPVGDIDDSFGTDAMRPAEPAEGGES